MSDYKVGLDYFELDCHLETKIRLIQAEFGLKGFAIVVKLYQKIYGELGYYCEWNEDSSLLFMSENGVSSCDEKNLINEIVAACIRRDIFSKKLFDRFSILTSAGVQKRYLKATSRREKVIMKKEYLLLSDAKNYSNVVIIQDNVDIMSDNVDIIGQSREEKSRVEYIYNSANPERFNDFWTAYPLSKNKRLAEEAYIDVISSTEYTEEQLIESAKNYAEYCKLTGTDKIYYPHNFLSKAHFEDYLSGRYKKPVKKSKNSFNSFNQNDYDIEKLESDILSN